MAKRDTGVGKNSTTRSHKTTKRLAIKQEMLDAKAAKKAHWRGETNKKSS